MKKRATLLWLRHYLELEEATRGEARIWINFESLSETATAHRIEFALATAGLEFEPAGQVSRSVTRVHDKNLVHWLPAGSRVQAAVAKHPWLAAAYGALEQLVRTDDLPTRQALDAVRHQLAAADALLLHDLAVVESERHGERYLKLRQEMVDYHRSIERQRMEIDAQRSELGSMRDSLVAWQQRQQDGLQSREERESRLGTTISERLSSLEQLLRGRLEQRHLKLLDKSLDVSATIEEEWKSTRAELTTSRSEVEQLQQRLASTERELSIVETRKQEALAQADSARALLERAIEERDLERRELQQILARRSWRLLKPVRRVYAAIKGLGHNRETPEIRNDS